MSVGRKQVNFLWRLEIMTIPELRELTKRFARSQEAIIHRMCDVVKERPKDWDRLNKTVYRIGILKQTVSFIHISRISAQDLFVPCDEEKR